MKQNTSNVEVDQRLAPTASNGTFRFLSELAVANTIRWSVVGNRRDRHRPSFDEREKRVATDVEVITGFTHGDLIRILSGLAHRDTVMPAKLPDSNLRPAQSSRCFDLLHVEDTCDLRIGELL